MQHMPLSKLALWERLSSSCDINSPGRRLISALYLNEGRFLRLAVPNRPIGKAEPFQRIRQNLDAVTSLVRNHVSSAANRDWMPEVLVEVVHVFDHSVFHRAGDAKEIEDRKMLNILAQADTTNMRTNRNAELRSHQNNC